jgi:hypothetical protein
VVTLARTSLALAVQMKFWIAVVLLDVAVDSPSQGVDATRVRQSTRMGGNNMNGKAAFSTAVFFFGTVCAFAERPKELEVYDRIVGSWTCVGQTMPSGTDTGHAFNATIKITRELAGGVYMDRYEEVQSAQHQQPFSSISLWTYDPQSGRYVQNGVDSSGNRYERTSTGWHSKEWIWEGKGLRIPVTSVSDGQARVRVELEKDGQWVTLSESTCNK